MFQLALFPDTPLIEYGENRVSINIYDVKTESDWNDIGFKVDHYEKCKPFIQTIGGTRFYKFDQVDIIRKVPTDIYNKRLWWLDNWQI